MQSASVERDYARLTRLVKPEPIDRTRLPAPDGGIDTNMSASELPPNQSPSIVNMFIREGRLVSDTGYVSLGTGEIEGVPQLAFQVNHAEGNRDTLLITTKTAYYLSPKNEWVGGDITLTGNINSPISAVSYAPFDWIIITNGVDPVFYFYLGSYQFMQFDITASVVCRSLAVFHESLLLIGTTENAVKHLRRVRMSDAGDPTHIQTIIEGATTGIAAIYDLLDTDDDLHCAYTLGQWLILYRHSSIMRATYFGLLNQILFWEYMITGEGAQSVGAVAPITIAQQSAYHVVVGTYDIYRYEGGYGLTPIGTSVWLSQLGATGALNQEAKSTVWCQFVSQWHEVWIGYPTDESLVPDTVLRIALGRQPAIYMRRFFNPMLGAGSLLTRFEEDQGVPVVLLAGPAGVFEYDFVEPLDDGAPIRWSFETKDVGDGGTLTRFNRMVLRGSAAFDIGVEVSLDRGRSWRLLATIDYAFAEAAVLTFDLTSEYLRLRLSGSDHSFTMTWLEVHSMFEGEWVPARVLGV